MTTILAFAFVIGVLVFVHELGHYLAARRVGVRVLKFSIGFGPRIVGFTRGATEYCIAAIPLGGFVKMAGETVEDERSGKPDEFLSKSKWERFQILIMGPAMNLLLAVLLLWVVLLQGADVAAYRDQPPVIGAMEAGSPAEKAGLAVGDRILRVDGQPVETWDELFLHIGTRPRREVTLVVDRGGEQIVRQVFTDAETKYEVGDIGVFPDTHPRVRSVRPGDPADAAGIKAGDLITAVNGKTISFSRQLTETIGKLAGEQVTLTVERNGQPLDLTVVPIALEDLGIVGIGIGIGDEVKRVEPGVVEAFGLSLERNWETTQLIFRTLVGLFTGSTSPKQLMGPVGIAQLSGESAESGLLPLLVLMASISLNLGLLNLLPIPVLDGGHILIMALEGVARRDFSVRMKERMLLAGFVLLMLLMVTVIYNDLTRVSWVENLMFWR